jgi:hypothetical protein
LEASASPRLLDGRAAGTAAHPGQRPGQYLRQQPVVPGREMDFAAALVHLVMVGRPSPQVAATAHDAHNSAGGQLIQVYAGRIDVQAEVFRYLSRGKG